jgi:hypothetical protein
MVRNKVGQFLPLMKNLRFQFQKNGTLGLSSHPDVGKTKFRI